jgi:hypothetical protein
MLLATLIVLYCTLVTKVTFLIVLAHMYCSPILLRCEKEDYSGSVLIYCEIKVFIAGNFHKLY